MEQLDHALENVLPTPLILSSKNVSNMGKTDDIRCSTIFLSLKMFCRRKCPTICFAAEEECVTDQVHGSAHDVGGGTPGPGRDYQILLSVNMNANIVGIHGRKT